MAKLASLKSEKRLLDRRAADQIRSHILEGVLPAGERLLETQLSEELEVSRGTVRSALAQLANEGLVKQVAFTRWEVSGASVSDAWEIYTLRGALEGLGARLAAANVQAADGKRLRAIAEELVQAVRQKRFQDAIGIDFDLHTAIVGLAHHKRLAEQHRFILQQVRFHMVQSGFLPDDYEALIAEHQKLIETVIAGDADHAETLARNHNEAEVKLLAKLLKQGASSAGAAREAAS
ncbi:GntR family transcriptional regulator [Mesorhizobium sp. BH1-1-5]|uniref:GntR family transcriptional regulator n=1 Tax=unclassified Mesorhizobium TaxID=325217 RepID=UPI00112BACCB|nr:MULTISPECIES: GntR family transcriptional regulator [unclassified Mesorhizobium]MBZ9991516.1 GntR family transcriptional regulator [Mesorhizobium sp. BH1-1-5]TPJ56037.1 GntR family transcriptional regulator [Mesorhizobium sp. B2-7-1]